VDADPGLIARLESDVARHPAERYPVQHALAQLRLGIALTDAGRPAEAEAPLTAAVRLLSADALRAQRAHAENALGAALRAAARPDDARAAFMRAAAAFEAAGDLETGRGAALFNLGLAQRELGEVSAAVESFRAARGLLPAANPAPARELGAALLAAGELDAAAAALREAVDLAQASGDAPGLGSAANILGLVHLAADRPREAVDALLLALAGHPRSIRPEGFAMAKANLALAHERVGDAPRARLAARQALAVAAAAPVREQAAGVLERLGGGAGDLSAVLRSEPRERGPAIVREELTRWAEVAPAERRVETAAWIDGVLERPGDEVDLWELWLGAALEAPPAAMQALVRAVVDALSDRDGPTRERVHADVSRAMARFHVPQMLRLKDTFDAAAGELGGGGSAPVCV